MKDAAVIPRLPFAQALALPWSALKLIGAQPGLMTVNVLVMTGLMLVMSRDYRATISAPLVFAFAVGGLSWIQPSQKTPTTSFPWGRLLRLGIGCYLLTVPFILIAALAGDLGKGAFLLLYGVTLAMHHLSMEFMFWWSPFTTNVLILAAVLPVCLAPARVAVHGQGARQALWFSVRCWLRNPVASLVIAIFALTVAAGLALVMAFYWRYGAQGRLVLYLSMAAASLLMIAVLVAFGRSMSTLEPPRSEAVLVSDRSEGG
jgi:hypothetical protein